MWSNYQHVLLSILQRAFSLGGILIDRIGLYSSKEPFPCVAPPSTIQFTLGMMAENALLVIHDSTLHMCEALASLLSEEESHSTYLASDFEAQKNSIFVSLH